MTSTIAKLTPTTSLTLLNLHVVAAIDLQAQLKQAQWNVRGPRAEALRAVFDRGAADAGHYADLLADRTASIGGRAAGTIQAVAQCSFLPHYLPQTRDAEENAFAAATALVAFRASLHDAVDLAGILGDFVTANLFDEILGHSEHVLWRIKRAATEALEREPKLISAAETPDAGGHEMPIRDQLELWLNGASGAGAYLALR